MNRVLFTLPWLDFPIYSYGFMIMTGFSLALLVAARRSRLVGLDPSYCLDLSLYLLVAGVVGSRIMFLAHQWEAEGFAHRPWIDLVNIRQGGLEFYGGLLLAAPVALLYLRRKRIPIARFLDLALPAVLLGLVFGRIGCFLNGCCFGRICATGSALGVLCVAYPQFDVDGRPTIPYSQHLQQGRIPPAAPDQPGWTVTPEQVAENAILPEAERWLHSSYTAGTRLSRYTRALVPSQLLSSLANALLFLLLAWYWHRIYGAPPERRRPARAGEVALVFAVGYAVVRFGLEFARSDTRAVALESWTLLGKPGLTISQVVSLGVLVPAGILLHLLRSGRLGRPAMESDPGSSAPSRKGRTPSPHRSSTR